jgi:4-hydroxy-tetrahydrodipicolinate synthase
MSLREKFSGTGIAIVTPFNEDDSIDWKSFSNLIEFWIKGKVEYLVVLGTTGESMVKKNRKYFLLLQNR